MIPILNLQGIYLILIWFSFDNQNVFCHFYLFLDRTQNILIHIDIIIMPFAIFSKNYNTFIFSPIIRLILVPLEIFNASS